MYKILQQDYYQSISSSLKSKFYIAADDENTDIVEILKLTIKNQK